MCLAAWDPYFQKDIVKLERIQRKAARFCTKNYHPIASVTEILHDLGWTSLELRRTMTRLTLLYKMTRRQIDIDVNTYLNPHTELKLGEAIFIDIDRKRETFFVFVLN